MKPFVYIPFVRRGVQTNNHDSSFVQNKKPTNQEVIDISSDNESLPVIFNHNHNNNIILSKHEQDEDEETSNISTTSHEDHTVYYVNLTKGFSSPLTPINLSSDYEDFISDIDNDKESIDLNEDDISDINEKEGLGDLGDLKEVLSDSSLNHWTACEKVPINFQLITSVVNRIYTPNIGQSKYGVRGEMQTSLGEFYKCTKCTSSCHQSCVGSRKYMGKKLFLCSKCRIFDNFSCEICHETIVETGFRCIRCSQLSHLKCQNDNLAILESDLTLDDLSSTYKCALCSHYDVKIESIVALRSCDPELKIPSEFNNSFMAFVKFQGLPHLDDSWVPGNWVENLIDFKLGYKDFRKKIGLTTREYLHPEFNESLFIIEKIIDVDMDLKILAKKPVEYLLSNDLINTVSVKWKSLDYNHIYAIKTVKPDHVSEDYMDFFMFLSQKTNSTISDLWTKFYSNFFEELKNYQKKIIHSYEYENIKELPKVFSEYMIQPTFTQNGTLKDYQLEGLNWLLYNWTRSSPCILADEMGLGKTIQIASFLSVLKGHYHYMPFLVVAPTSLLENWKNELSKWAPDLISVIYSGESNKRKFIRENEIFPPFGYNFKPSNLQCDVLIKASYENIMNESNLFKKIQWKVLVCDEGHRLKNDAAKTFSAIGELKAEQKIILSGTPLQNNIKELFTLMKFLEPERFNDILDWESNYKELDESKIPQLHEVLKPYFLRRTKAVVLKQLPPLVNLNNFLYKQVELIVPVSMTSIQKGLYKAVLQKNISLLKTFSHVASSSNNVSTGNKSAHVMNIVMELRKICGHPYLLNHDMEPLHLGPLEVHQALIDASGKLQLLNSMLPKLFERGHRVLFFSQFKIVLDIIEDYLDGETFKYLRLDGHTPIDQRQTMINSFNRPDSDIFLMLLTTRTGGLGLNLATADTVIIFDPDWNPHQDQQAIARAHRIGQNKPVITYKFYTKNCVEERIIDISKKKMVLDLLVVGKMDNTTLDKQELSSILSFGADKLFGLTDPDQAETIIKYDDEEIEKLLDRDAIVKKSLINQKEATFDSVQKSSLSFARTWALDTTTDETLTVDDIELSPNENNINFWDIIIEKTQKEMAAGEKNVLSEKRKRKEVKYDGFYDPEKTRSSKKIKNLNETNPINNDIDWTPVDGGTTDEESDMDESNIIHNVISLVYNSNHKNSSNSYNYFSKLPNMSPEEYNNFLDQSGANASFRMVPTPPQNPYPVNQPHIQQVQSSSKSKSSKSPKSSKSSKSSNPSNPLNYLPRLQYYYNPLPPFPHINQPTENTQSISKSNQVPYQGAHSTDLNKQNPLPIPSSNVSRIKASIPAIPIRNDSHLINRQNLFNNLIQNMKSNTKELPNPSYPPPKQSDTNQSRLPSQEPVHLNNTNSIQTPHPINTKNNLGSSNHANKYPAIQPNGSFNFIAGVNRINPANIIRYPNILEPPTIIIQHPTIAKPVHAIQPKNQLPESSSFGFNEQFKSATSKIQSIVENSKMMVNSFNQSSQPAQVVIEKITKQNNYDNNNNNNSNNNNNNYSNNNNNNYSNNNNHISNNNNLNNNINNNNIISNNNDATFETIKETSQPSKGPVNSPTPSRCILCLSSTDIHPILKCPESTNLRMIADRLRNLSNHPNSKKNNEYKKYIFKRFFYINLSSQSAFTQTICPFCYEPFHSIQSCSKVYRDPSSVYAIIDELLLYGIITRKQVHEFKSLVSQMSSRIRH